MLRTIKTIILCSVACITAVTLGMFNKDGNDINALISCSAPKKYNGSTFRNDGDMIEDICKYVGLNSTIYSAYLASGNYITVTYIHGGYNKNRYCCVYHAEYEGSTNEFDIDKDYYDILKKMYKESDTHVNSFKKARNKKLSLSAIFPSLAAK